MQLVQQTILQFTVLVGLVFALTWVLMSVLMGTTSQAAKLFMAANLALVVGVVLTGLRTPERSYLYYHVADWATIVGFGCLHRGLLHLIDADRPPALHSVIGRGRARPVQAHFAVMLAHLLNAVAHRVAGHRYQVIFRVF